MQSDIVKRLLAVQATLTDDNWHTEATVAAEAATEITALRDRVAKLEGALHFYADEHKYPSDGPWGRDSDDWGKVASAALYDAPPAEVADMQLSQTVPGRFGLHHDVGDYKDTK
jgi:hypothetical protein